MPTPQFNEGDRVLVNLTESDRAGYPVGTFLGRFRYYETTTLGQGHIQASVILDGGRLVICYERNIQAMPGVR
jgi:hypothetical protein